MPTLHDDIELSKVIRRFIFQLIFKFKNTNLASKGPGEYIFFESHSKANTNLETSRFVNSQKYRRVPITQANGQVPIFPGCGLHGQFGNVLGSKDLSLSLGW